MEELAGMQILCSDKTGTLTKNKLTLGEPIVYESIPSHKVVLFAAYASDQNSGDAIDLAVIDRLSEEEKNARKGFLHFFCEISLIFCRSESVGI